MIKLTDRPKFKTLTDALPKAAPSANDQVEGGQMSPRLVREIPIPKPAFLRVGPAPEDLQESRLWVSSFDALFGDKVRTLDPNQEPAGIREVTSKVTWPNQVTFDGDQAVIAGGFLLPWKSNGGIFRGPLGDPSQLHKITKFRCGWFYHRAVMHDVNGDGRPDIITARAKKPLFLGEPKGELLWLEQPKDSNSPWREHKIASGPDVNFAVRDLDGDGSPEIIASQFFGKQLSLHWQEKGEWRQRCLDSQLGSGFDLEFADLEDNGRSQLLVSNHEAINGSVFAYDIPNHPKQDSWTRRTLLDGLDVVKKKPGSATPGGPTVFWPQSDEQGKPWVAVSGDGDQRVHWLIPGDKPGEYRHEQTPDLQSVVGQVLVADMNKDGRNEIYVPLYNLDKIQVYELDSVP